MGLGHLKHPLKTIDRYWRPVSDRGRMTVMGGSHIDSYIPIPCIGTNKVMSRWLHLYSHVSDFFFLVEAHGRSMGHRVVECASIPLSLSLYWTFRVHPGKQWSFTGALSNQLPQVIHLGYIAAWNQLPRDRGGVTSTAGCRWKVSDYYTPWTLTYEIPLGSPSGWKGTDGGTD